MRYSLPRALLTCAVLISATGAWAQAPAGGMRATANAPHPVVGGWSAVSVGDQEVKAAAQAMLAKLPVRNPRLRHIETAERQIVAGVNYRLTLRLTQGGRWRGTVWRKLDNSYAVSQVARVK